MSSHTTDILLVEDEAAHVELIRRAFESHREAVRLRVAASLEEGRAAVAASRPNLIITDVRLPDGEGIEILPADKEEVTVPVVVLTAFGSEEVAVEAMRRGAMDYVVKSETALAEMPRIAQRALREWDHILARRRAEETVLKERDRAKEYLRIAGTMILVINMDETVALVNNKACEVLGYTEEEIVGANWFDRFLPETQRDRIREVFGKLFAGEVEPVEWVENPVLTSKGEERSILWHNTILRDDAGHVIGSLTSGEDITERRLAEEALRHSEERFRAVFEQAASSIVVIDADTGAIVEFNDRAHNSLGYTREEFQGFSLADIDVIESAEDVAQHMTQMMTQGADVFETKHRGKDGSIHEVLVNTRALRLPGGNLLMSIWTDITARKQAEEALRESEARFARFMDHLPGVAFISVPGEHMVYANKRMQEVYGLELEEMLGRPFEEFNPPEHVARIKRQDAQVISKDFTLKVEEIIPEVSGPTHWLTYKFPIHRQDAPTLVGGIAVDISDRKRAERDLKQAHDQLETRVRERTAELAGANEALRHEVAERQRVEEKLRLEEARLEALLHLSQMNHASFGEIASFVLDQGITLTGSGIGFLGLLNEDELVYTVHAYSRGVTEACGVTNPPIEWVIAESGVWAEGIRQRKAFVLNDYAAPHPGKKGLPEGHVPIERSMVVPVFEDGKIVAAVAVGNKASDYDDEDERQLMLLMRGAWSYAQRNRAEEAMQEANRRLEEEVAERKHAEELTRASEERFRMAFEEGPLGIALCTVDGGFLQVNRAFCELLRYTKEELFDKTVADITHPDDLQEDLTLSQQVIEGKIPTFTLEKRYVRKDGRTVWARLTSAALHNSEGELLGALGMVEDVTEQKKAEAALHRSERLASIGTLAAGIAHEINNPLSAIAAYTQAARLSKDRPDRLQTLDDSLRAIENQVFRCSRIVKSVLQFSREEESRKWPCNLSEVVRQARDMLREYADDRQVSITLEISDRVHEIEINPTEMEQVFVNLIHNAVGASEPGGEVSVRAELAGDALRVQVQDQGRGMTPDEVDHIFDPFYTTRQQDGGTGLGLSVSHGIIRHHGGTMDVQSSPGRGTTMTFVLPVVTPATGQETDAENPRRR